MPSKQNTTWRRGLEEVLGADMRSLALFRICLGGLVLADLVLRSIDLRAHYTDFGVLPRGVLWEMYSGWHISLHTASGSGLWQVLLFMFAGLLSCCFILGYRTRTVTVLLWFLTISLQNRNPMILYGADQLLRMLLFWSMFLPLGAYWSLDSRSQAVNENASRRTLSMGSAALLAQIVLMYVFSALLKSGEPWRDGTAVYYALNVDQMVKPLGQFLTAFPQLMAWGSYATYYLELIGPFFLLCPFYTGPVRTAAIFIFILLQISFGLCLKLGIFPFTVSIAMLALLPGWFWQRWPAEWGQRLATRLRCLFPRQLIRLRPNQNETKSLLYRTLRWPATLFCFAMIVFVLFLNINTLPKYQETMPKGLFRFAESLRTDQFWNLFAPYPMTDDGWYVMPAQRKDSGQFDLVTGNAVSWEKPELVIDRHWGNRWQQYLFNLWSIEYQWARNHFGRYICRKWNGCDDEAATLDTFEIYYMLEETPPPGQTGSVEKVKIWEHYCFGLK
jgi:hypothetical protein